MLGFNVVYRNPGHWDIWNDKRRIFCIRGGPGSYYIRDERCMLPVEHEHYKYMEETVVFKTVQACMSYIIDILMFELITVKGQKTKKIESWNVKYDL